MKNIHSCPLPSSPTTTICREAMEQHAPSHTIEQLQGVKKQEAVAMYKVEVGYFIDMGTALPELNDKH